MYRDMIVPCFEQIVLDTLSNESYSN